MKSYPYCTFSNDPRRRPLSFDCKTYLLVKIFSYEKNNCVLHIHGSVLKSTRSCVKRKWWAAPPWGRPWRHLTTSNSHWLATSKSQVMLHNNIKQINTNYCNTNKYITCFICVFGCRDVLSSLTNLYSEKLS